MVKKYIVWVVLVHILYGPMLIGSDTFLIPQITLLPKIFVKNDACDKVKKQVESIDDANVAMLEALAYHFSQHQYDIGKNRIAPVYFNPEMKPNSSNKFFDANNKKLPMELRPCTITKDFSEGYWVDEIARRLFLTFPKDVVYNICNYLLEEHFKKINDIVTAALKEQEIAERWRVCVIRAIKSLLERRVFTNSVEDNYRNYINYQKRWLGELKELAEEFDNKNLDFGNLFYENMCEAIKKDKKMLPLDEGYEYNWGVPLAIPVVCFFYPFALCDDDLQDLDKNYSNFTKASVRAYIHELCSDIFQKDKKQVVVEKGIAVIIESYLMLHAPQVKNFCLNPTKDDIRAKKLTGSMYYASY
ncbi:MAG: hypothetical protein WBQ73_02845 [Candidatus Babeliales bacterium]